MHAGINPSITLANQQIRDLLYIKEEFYRNKTKLDKIVVFGHTITVDIHGKADIWFDEDKIGIDGGCAFGYQLNCLELIEGKVTNTYHIKAKNPKTSYKNKP